MSEPNQKELLRGFRQLKKSDPESVEAKTWYEKKLMAKAFLLGKNFGRAEALAEQEIRDKEKENDN